MRTTNEICRRCVDSKAYSLTLALPANFAGGVWTAKHTAQFLRYQRILRAVCGQQSIQPNLRTTNEICRRCVDSKAYNPICALPAKFAGGVWIAKHTAQFAHYQRILRAVCGQQSIQPNSCTTSEFCGRCVDSKAYSPICALPANFAGGVWTAKHTA